ncbi:astacin-like metalloendopeptidase [Schistocerca gregaria]|uniref:astacin-like metalloendopeptidase n=1 Tax=Schistocerca gregaria TaxID=7010 RepID=UPI00211ECC5B|nr:astacin-like metalloendopeptidase [Schistocerca gregaria]
MIVTLLIVTFLYYVETTDFSILRNTKAATIGTNSYPELGKFYQGDIIFPTGSRNALAIPSLLWPKGIIPYKFDPSYTKKEENMVTEAMESIENKTCVKFTKQEKQKQYIFLTKKRDGCYSVVGYRATAQAHTLNLQSPECFDQMGTIQHELLHVLGLLHEQARPDRDDFVKIYWENMDKAYHPDFIKAKEPEFTTFGLPYDYSSIMHYPRTAFSKDGKLPTIVAKHNEDLELGQRKAPTDIDLQKIRKLYHCTEK